MVFFPLALLSAPRGDLGRTPPNLLPPQQLHLQPWCCLLLLGTVAIKYGQGLLSLTNLETSWRR
jgi:hypothetical protein